MPPIFLIQTQNNICEQFVQGKEYPSSSRSRCGKLCRVFDPDLQPFQASILSTTHGSNPFLLATMSVFTQKTMPLQRMPFADSAIASNAFSYATFQVGPFPPEQRPSSITSSAFHLDRTARRQHVYASQELCETPYQKQAEMDQSTSFCLYGTYYCSIVRVC